MERTFWSDERLDKAFDELRAEIASLRREIREEMRELRREVCAEISQMKLFMLGGLVTILAATVGFH